MLIDDYDIELSTPACDLTATVYTARISVESDLSEVLPYVNATVEKGEFLPDRPVLVFRERAHKYALRPREISISNVADRDEASEEAPGHRREDQRRLGEPGEPGAQLLHLDQAQSARGLQAPPPYQLRRVRHPHLHGFRRRGVQGEEVPRGLSSA